MIISIWVFFMLGEPSETAHGTPYTQLVTSSYVHDRQPELAERACAADFHELYPGVVVCDSGWCRQSVRVMGDG